MKETTKNCDNNKYNNQEPILPFSNKFLLNNDNEEETIRKTSESTIGLYSPRKFYDNKTTTKSKEPTTVTHQQNNYSKLKNVSSELIVIIYYLGNIEVQKNFVYNPQIINGIKLGRGTDCDVVLKDPTASKIMCRAEYDLKSKKWVISKGSGYTKPQDLKNPVWISPTGHFELSDNLVFKFNGARFRCSLVDSNNKIDKISPLYSENRTVTDTN